MKPLQILALALTLIALPLGSIYPDEHKAKRVAPIRHLPGHEERKREAEAQREAVESGQLAPLSEEAAIQPTRRAPITSTDFDGMDFNDTPGFVPPDTHAATGPNHIVETVNTTVSIFNRAGALVSGPTDLSVFFSSVEATTDLSDPVVAYDELAGRFFIGVIDFGLSGTTTNLLYAVSNSSDPTAGFTEKHSIPVTEPANSGCPVSDTVLADFTRVGWNADAHVFTFNMFNVAGTCFDHVAVITIVKSTVLDADITTFAFFHSDRSGSDNFAMAPATMHESVTGDPMWFAESVFFNQIRVVKMTNVLTAPIFTNTDVPVATYGLPPSATQQGGGTFIDTGDTRVLNAEWRDDQLVAAHTVGSSGAAHARWYEFNTASGTPTLTQQGTISPGSGIHTYYPSIAIAENGDLGMTFMQSSTTQFMSMYVTGRLAADPLGTMQTPLLARAGQRNYIAFDCDGIPFGESNVCRAGDYSGITVDPDLTNVFCAANEYATSTAPASNSANWGTHIACFSLGTHDLAVTKITPPKSVKGTAAVTLPVKVTIQNRSDHSEKIPDASYLGNGTTTGLVRLTVDVIDPGAESCAAAIVALDGLKNAALFSKGPKVLKPKGRLTINFVVTYHCASAQLLDKTDPAHGDYSHTATVYHDVIDPGVADSHAADDSCPHNPLFDSNPPPAGMTDKGCGAKKPDGTLGGAVVTDVVL